MGELKEFDVTGHEIIEGTHEALDARDAVIRYMTANPLADVDAVGSRSFIGLCENTGAVILEGDEYTTDEEDGVFILTRRVDDLGENDKVFTSEEDEDGEPESAEQDEP